VTNAEIVRDELRSAGLQESPQFTHYMPGLWERHGLRPSESQVRQYVRDRIAAQSEVEQAWRG